MTSGAISGGGEESARRVDGAPLHEPDDEVEEEVAAEPRGDAPHEDLAVVRPGARRGHVPRQPGPSAPGMSRTCRGRVPPLWPRPPPEPRHTPLPGDDGRVCPEPAPNSVVGGRPPRAVHVEQGGRLVVVVSKTLLPRSDPLQRCTWNRAVA